MIKPAFIDLSHHNTIPDSFEDAKASGILGVIHKATEGTSHVDSKVDARYFLARDAGMLWGLYHFVRPGSMEDQADHFLNIAFDLADENTLLCLDWEDPGVSVDDAVEFMQIVEARTGHAPVLYSGHVVKEALDGVDDPRLSKYRLWLCHYTTGTPVLPPGWDSYWAWQYTDEGSAPGIDPPTDLNAFEGTAEELRRNWSGVADLPEPEPEPEPPDMLVTVIVPPGVDVKVITRTAARRRW